MSTLNDLRKEYLDSVESYDIEEFRRRSSTYRSISQLSDGTVSDALVDGSAAITAGGTAQQVFAALPHRRYLFIQNISDTVLWINFGVSAVADSPSIQIAVGGTYTLNGSFCDNRLVSIIGATTGKKFVAKQGR